MCVDWNIGIMSFSVNSELHFKFNEEVEWNSWGREAQDKSAILRTAVT